MTPPEKKFSGGVLLYMPVTAESKAAITVTPVVHTMPADLLTPLAVYLKLSENSSHSFLLESVEGGRSLARYSFVGADPEMVVRGTDRQIEIIDEASGRSVRETGLIDFLKEHFYQNIAGDDQKLPAFIGGAIGYLGFDCCEWFEPSLRQPDPEAEGAFMVFRSVVAFDHARQVISIISLADTSDNVDLNDGTSAKGAHERNRKIRERLEGQMPEMPAAVPSVAAETISNWSREDFEAAVSSIKELIYAGECYQAVLSQCFSRQTSASPIAIYRALRSLNPSHGTKSVSGRPARRNPYTLHSRIVPSVQPTVPARAPVWWLPHEQ